MSRYYRLRVELRGIRPPAWRRFLLLANSSFADLHRAIQDSCGWEDCHMYTFLEAGARGAELPSVCSADGQASWSETQLALWFSGREPARKRCVYWYDFGDDWMHEVELEGVEEHAEDHGRRLLAGARSFPPEDCGGPPGYARCLEALERRRSRATGSQVHPGDEAELLEWLGDWEPERFDLEEARRHFERGAERSEPHPGESATPWLSASLTDFITDSGRERTDSGPAQRLARQLGRIVMAASLCAPGEEVTTGLACRRRPARRRCRGHITVVGPDANESVDWRCSVCEDGGVVTGWSGGPSDLRQPTVEAGARSAACEIHVRVPVDVYEALLDGEAMDVDSEQILYSARASAGQVVLQGSEDEIDDLYEQCCADANHAPRGVRRRRLESACEILRSALGYGRELESELKEGYPDASSAEERSMVAEATRDLELAPEELDGLGLLARETGRILRGTDLDFGDALQKVLRGTAESIVIERELRGVLAPDEPDSRSAADLLCDLEGALGLLEAFAERAPEACLMLYGRFLSGLGELAERIPPDGSELAAFAERVARAALVLARRNRSPTMGTRPLLAELLGHWLADGTGVFGFVPDLIVGLGLGKRERAWLLKELQRATANLSGGRTSAVEALETRLS